MANSDGVAIAGISQDEFDVLPDNIKDLIKSACDSARLLGTTFTVNREKLDALVRPKPEAPIDVNLYPWQHDIYLTARDMTKSWCSLRSHVVVALARSGKSLLAVSLVARLGAVMLTHENSENFNAKFGKYLTKQQRSNVLYGPNAGVAQIIDRKPPVVVIDEFVWWESHSLYTRLLEAGFKVVAITSSDMYGDLGKWTGVPVTLVTKLNVTGTIRTM